MLSDDQSRRYLRHILLREVGAQGQQALLGARVCVVGVGGLGGPVVQYLAAAGVGHLTLVDPDTVDLTNLQRQVQFRTVDIGAGKAAIAADMARAINPGIAVVAITGAVDAANAARIVAGADLVVEGVDRFETRFELAAACMAARIPLLSGAIGRFEGQVALFEPFAGDLPCYGCLVPAPPPREDVMTCAEEGVLGPVAGVVGSMLALEAVKRIVGIGPSLAGHLVVFDALTGGARRVGLPRDPQCAFCATLPRD